MCVRGEFSLEMMCFVFCNFGKTDSVDGIETDSVWVTVFIICENLVNQLIFKK